MDGPVDANFDTAFRAFVAGCARINDEQREALSHQTEDLFSFTTGKRYAKVIRHSNNGHGQSSVHCFVNMGNGDVLKAAGWKAPAKHARGNIYDDQGGLGSMGMYGPAYLR